MEDCYQSSVTAWCENFEQNGQFSCSVSIKNGNQQMTADNGETIVLITFFQQCLGTLLSTYPGENWQQLCKYQDCAGGCGQWRDNSC